MPKKPTAPLKNRMWDEELGIGPGVDFLPNLHKNEEHIPDISELGLPSSVRRKLDALVPEHVEYGKQERAAKKGKETITAAIKELWEDIGDEVKSFTCQLAKVTRSVTMRPTFDQQACRMALLSLGVKQDIVNKAWDKATSKVPVVTLRVTSQDEEEE